MIKLSTLKPNPDNPRTIKDDKFQKLVASLKEFPEMMDIRPVIVNEENIIMGGNMRYNALIEIGYSEVPDSWVKRYKDLRPDQWHEFIIKDNLPYGQWDYDALANGWDDKDLEKWGLDIPGFEPLEEEKEDDKKAISTRLIVECGDLVKLSALFSELQDRGFNCELKE